MKPKQKINNCKTVAEVETLCCYDCSNDHHFGWCDAPWIMCKAKDRIKEITGEQGYTITNLEKHIDGILEKHDIKKGGAK